MCFRPAAIASDKIACPMCGHENPISATVCEECGFAAKGAASAPAAPGAPKAPGAPAARALLKLREPLQPLALPRRRKPKGRRILGAKSQGVTTAK